MLIIDTPHLTHLTTLHPCHLPAVRFHRNSAPRPHPTFTWSAAACLWAGLCLRWGVHTQVTSQNFFFLFILLSYLHEGFIYINLGWKHQVVETYFKIKKMILCYGHNLTNYTWVHWKQVWSIPYESVLALKYINIFWDRACLDCWQIRFVSQIWCFKSQGQGQWPTLFVSALFPPKCRQKWKKTTCNLLKCKKKKTF